MHKRYTVRCVLKLSLSNLPVIFSLQKRLQMFCQEKVIWLPFFSERLGRCVVNVRVCASSGRDRVIKETVMKQPRGKKRNELLNIMHALV